jgi:uncharacterized protein YhdP
MQAFRVKRALVYLLVAAIFVLASLSVALSLSLQWLSKQPEQGSQKLSAWLGVELSYEDLAFEQQGAQFNLQVSQFSLKLAGAEEASLSIQSLGFDLDIIKSLIRRAPAGEALALGGVAFEQRHASSDRSTPLGWEAIFSTLRNSVFYALTAWDRVDVDHARLKWPSKASGHWELNLSRLPAETFASLDERALPLRYALRYFATEAQAPSRDFSGEWLLAPRAGGIESWFNFNQDQLGLNLEINWRHADQMNAQLYVKHGDFGLSAEVIGQLDAQAFEIQKLNTWHFKPPPGEHFPLQSQQTQPIRVTRQAGGWMVRGDELNLALFNPYLLATQRTFIPKLSGWGDFFSLWLDDQDWMKHQGRITLRDTAIGFQSLRQWSGIGSLVSFSAGRVTVDFEKQGTSTLTWPRLFERPVALENFSGQLTLDLQNPSAWSLSSQDLRLQPKGLGAIQVELGLSQEQETRLNLAMDFPSLPRDQAVDLLPRVLDASLKQWLREHWREGRLEAGRFELAGPLEHLGQVQSPQDRVRFSARLDAVAVQLDGGWSPLEALNAQLRYWDGDLTIDQGVAKTRGQTLENLALRLDKTQGFARLHLSGESRPQGEDLLAYLRESPLASVFTPQAFPIEVKGPLEAALSLVIPLEKEDPGSLQYQVELGMNRAAMFLWDQSVSAVAGRLSINAEGIHASDLRGVWRGQAVRASIHPQRHEAQTWLALEVQTAQTLDLQHLKGPMSVKAQIYLPWQNVRALHGRVDLETQHLALQFPQPFDKASGEIWPAAQLHFVKDMAQEGVHWAGFVDQKFYAHGLFDPQNPQKLTQVDVQWQRDFAPRPVLDTHFTWSVEAPMIQLDAWREFVSTLKSQGARFSLTTRGQLLVSQIQRGDQVFSGLTARIESQGDRWISRVSSDWIEGRVEAQLGRFVHADLQRLHWPNNPIADSVVSVQSQGEQRSISAQQAQSGVCRPIHMAGMDLLSLSVADFKLGPTSPSAELTMVIKDRVDRLEVSQLRLKNADIDLNGQLNWFPQRATAQTEFTLTVDARDLKNIGEWTGLATGSFKATSIQVSAQGGWPGVPHCLDVAKLDLTGKIQTGSGSVVEAEPGLGRILGLLNVTSLTKRLFYFDLSDFFGQGLVFDGIRSGFALEQGKLHLADFRLRSSATQVELTGNLDFNQGAYALNAQVRPNIKEAMVTLGFLAGGPVGGLGAWLVSKMVNWLSNEEPLNFYYQITGPFREPQITSIKALPEK